LNRRNLNPRRYARWEEEALTRVEEALLVVSVVTVAEARAGYVGARWGGRRLAAAEQELDAPCPCGNLQPVPTRQRRRVALSDNDLWIAATASAREQVLVTCDRDHERIAAEMPVEVVFLPPPV
jgi:predicted nucleic acid-binding protein